MTDQQRLARALFESVLAAQVVQDPHHDSPPWRDLNHWLAGAEDVYLAGPWLSVAREMLARGVRAPGRAE